MPLYWQEFLQWTLNVMSRGRCVLCSGRITQMEIPPSSAVGAVVFLLESKNWENGSNNYITDATKQAVGVEGSDKCFHHRVTSQTVKSTVGWGKLVHPFVSVRHFFKYRGVCLNQCVSNLSCLGFCSLSGERRVLSVSLKKVPLSHDTICSSPGSFTTPGMGANGTHRCSCVGVCTRPAHGGTSICVCLVWFEAGFCSSTYK